MYIYKALRVRLGKLWQKTYWRYIFWVLVADGIGYGLVYYLTSQEGMGTVSANTLVSKGMAPVGLALNSLALTGRWLPNRQQATDWLACWLPSSLRNTYYLIFLVTVFGVEGVTARAVAGLTFFPIDYVIKKYVVFGKHGERIRFHITKAWVNFKISGLLVTETAESWVAS